MFYVTVNGTLASKRVTASEAERIAGKYRATFFAAIVRIEPVAEWDAWSPFSR